MAETDMTGADHSPGGKLGTFSGVFTPSILTILGIILFMRLGYVVGNAGLKQALVIIALANVISVLTSISLSAVATNLKVKGGGDYYLISRTLGLEFGGAIGIVLFLAQSVSIAFYCIGFGEAVDAMCSTPAPMRAQGIAAGAAALLFIFAWLGSDWATKFQYLVMAALAASLVSFFSGAISRWDFGLLAENWSAGPSGSGFWVLFAIFFPAVTGFTQGVSMSGDLKDPGRSLPLGTFMAVGLSILVYFGAALVFAAGLPQASLAHDTGAMKNLSLFGVLIDAGVIAATLSSAMASFLGAPRILQSVAKDRIFPFLGLFARGKGSLDNPRNAVLLSAAIAFACIGLGKLNLIAPIVSMFFLISYGLLNYATFFEARAASPSFRPRFRWFDYRLSLLGGLACLGFMLAIDFAAGLVAVSVLAAIYQYLKRTAKPSRWADSQRSHHFQRLREHLMAITEEPEHPRDWRPRLLVFSKDPMKRAHLLRFSSWIEGGSGLTTAVQILEGRGPRLQRLREEAENRLREHIAEQGLKAFSLAITGPNLMTAAEILIQSHGLGAVRPNTVILNWMEQKPDGLDEQGRARYGRYLRVAPRLGCNVVVLDTEDEEWERLMEKPPDERCIDVWWWNDATSRLMLLLAYLVTRDEAWKGARIRVMTSASGGDREKDLEELNRMLDEARIRAEPEVLKRMDAKTVIDHSKEASLVFLPLRIQPDYQPAAPFEIPLETLFSELPVTSLVLAAEDIPLDANPEEGVQGETAVRVDLAQAARKKAEDAEEDAEKAVQKALRKKADHAAALEKDARSEKTLELEAEAREAEALAEKAIRRAARLKVKAEYAIRAAEAPQSGSAGSEGRETNAT